MAKEILAEQSIIVFPERSRSAADIIKRGGNHPLVKLEKQYPGKWLQESHFLPYCMRLSVEARNHLRLEKADLLAIHAEVSKIIKDLPAEFRYAYKRVLSGLRKAEVNEMDIPRVIEYLTMVSARYVVDCIRERNQGLPAITFEGYTLPPSSYKLKAGYLTTEVLIFHNHSARSVDQLMIECVLLSSKKIKSVLENKEMDLLSILRQKCLTFDASPPLEVPEKSQHKRPRGLRKIAEMLKSMRLAAFTFLNTS